MKRFILSAFLLSGCATGRPPTTIVVTSEQGPEHIAQCLNSMATAVGRFNEVTATATETIVSVKDPGGLPVRLTLRDDPAGSTVEIQRQGFELDTFLEGLRETCF